MLSDSILSNAGWLCFAAYSAILVVVNCAAFGRDLLPAKVQADAPRENGSIDRVQSASRR
jgi:hypothetical protein